MTSNPEKMQVVQAVRPGDSFELSRKPIPHPGPNQVRIAVHACGVCGGDALARNGLLGVQLPRTPGHKIAGVIDKIGEGVTSWKVGDRVGVGFHGGHCFVCGPCREGDFTNCVDGPITGLSTDGGFAEFTLARQAAYLTHVNFGIGVGHHRNDSKAHCEMNL